MRSCDNTWAGCFLAASRGVRATLGMLFLAWGAWAMARAAAPGESVVVVYREGNADSRAVAEHYARARGVPKNNVVGLRTSSEATLSRADYEAQVEGALIRELGKRGLATFEAAGSAKPSLEGTVKTRCTASSVRFIVLCYGMPYRIANDPARLAGQTNGVPPPLQRNNASVDSELCLLPLAGRYPIVAGIANPVYANTNRATLHPTNGFFIVGRVDGPGPDVARRMVDHAVAAEARGFMGDAYFDLRNIPSGSYRVGDLWITNAAAAARRGGFAVRVDNEPATLPATFPLANVGLYFGWYTGVVDGPFARKDVELLPGSIAYHLHSYSAADPRSPTNHWVGPLLAKGATVTFGSVDEPYLEFTPNPHVFLELTLMLGFTVGEAGLVSQPYLSWANAFFGDPLYQPFDPDLRAAETRQYQAKSPAQAWTILRQVHLLLQSGQGNSAVRGQLEAYPLATNHPVLAEKIAQLYAADSIHRTACQWYQSALDLQPSPQHRLRMLLALSESQSFSRQHKEAQATLRAVEELRPDYKDLLSFRQRQLDVAKDLLDVPEIDRLQDELRRLKSGGAAKPAK